MVNDKMICTVVPVQNEAENIERVMSTLLSLPTEIIIPVINGSTDRSAEIIAEYPSDRVHVLEFNTPLGIDVPRAVGGAYAKRLGADIVLFVDGDMIGNIRRDLIGLIDALKEHHADMALTDCYAGRFQPGSVQAQHICYLRELFNRTIGFDYLRTASPSHGPHAVSRRFLETVPMADLGVPPVTLAVSARTGLKVVIGAVIPHCALGSPDKSSEHIRLILDTLMGDYLEAFAVYHGKERSRTLYGTIFDGYHSTRRFDLLKEFLESM